MTQASLMRKPYGLVCGVVCQVMIAISHSWQETLKEQGHAMGELGYAWSFARSQTLAPLAHISPWGRTVGP